MNGNLQNLCQSGLPSNSINSKFAHINHTELCDHIERVGVVFYDKSTDKNLRGDNLSTRRNIVKSG